MQQNQNFLHAIEVTQPCIQQITCNKWDSLTHAMRFCPSLGLAGFFRFFDWVRWVVSQKTVLFSTCWTLGGCQFRVSRFYRVKSASELPEKYCKMCAYRQSMPIWCFPLKESSEMVEIRWKQGADFVFFCLLVLFLLTREFLFFCPPSESNVNEWTREERLDYCLVAKREACHCALAQVADEFLCVGAWVNRKMRLWDETRIVGEWFLFIKTHTQKQRSAKDFFKSSSGEWEKRRCLVFLPLDSRSGRCFGVSILYLFVFKNSCSVVGWLAFVNTVLLLIYNKILI